MTQKVSTVEEYIQFHTTHIHKYGMKTYTLMEVGKFYESYSFNLDVCDENGPNLWEISGLINIQHTKRNSKEPSSRSNPYLVGFPIAYLADKMKILMDNCYTVVLMNQIEISPGKFIRKVSNVCTPGLNMVTNTSYSNYIVSIYLKGEEIKNKELLSIGAIACDITTNKIFYTESYATVLDDKLSLDELALFIKIYYPKEILIHINTKNTNIDFIKSYLELSDIPIKVFDEINPHYFKLQYQTEIVKNIYPKHGIISPIEYIGFAKLPYCMVSFVILLDYINSINPSLLNNLSIPKKFYGKPTLRLENNAISQLNVFRNQVDMNITNKKFKSLFDIVDNTSTSIGKRFMIDILNNPLTDEDIIQNMYDITEVIINNKYYEKYMTQLKMIGDIEKIYRKMILKNVTSHDLYIFIQSITTFNDIMAEINNDSDLIDIIDYPKNINNIHLLVQHCEKIFNIEGLKASTDGTSSFYNTSVHPDIDKLYELLSDKINFIENLREKLSSLLGKSKILTTKKNDRNGYYYGITKIRATQLQEKLKDIKYIQVGNIKINTSDIVFKPNPVGIIKIIVPEIDTNSDDIINIKNEIREILNTHFTSDISDIVSQFGPIIKNAINFISKFDYCVSNAKTSTLYGYTRPVIDNQEYGYVECEQLRHPIIERLIDYEYVAHDVSLGKNLKGLLLYGLNSSGKSSMMKALGIGIIMAQCGMFVPAKKFIYSPYTSIFTRISGNDNIFKELSSFSVEMIELKAIWKRSDMKSLIIGDEVCRGTEQVSANSIVAATLIRLSQQKASFIFATHLHEIVKLPQIQKIKNIKAFHLSVSYDNKNDRLVFDRLLKEGSGEEIYGITVAKYIIQDDDFTTMANDIKNEIIGIKNNIIQPKVSKYNSHVYINKCSICGRQLQVKDDIVNLDTHHINHQKDCIDGVVGDKKFMKKNDKSNLIILCKKCHNRLHNGEITIDKYIASTSGKILKYKE